MQIPAKDTSRECHVCGYVDKENRQIQSLFKCVKRGHNDNADVNANKNIKREGLARLTRLVNCNSSQQRENLRGPVDNGKFVYGRY